MSHRGGRVDKSQLVPCSSSSPNTKIFKGMQLEKSMLRIFFFFLIFLRRQYGVNVATVGQHAGNIPAETAAGGGTPTTQASLRESCHHYAPSFPNAGAPVALGILGIVGDPTYLNMISDFIAKPFLNFIFLHVCEK